MTVSTLLVITGVYLAALAIPGPNFLMVSRVALGGDRLGACAVAAGIVAGSAIWASGAMVGLAAILLRAPWLARALRLGGAAYLVWYGVRLLRAPARTDPVAVAGASELGRGARTGFVTSLTNPKAGIFWTSVFAATLPAGARPAVYLLIGLTIVMLSAAWHLGLAVLLAAPPMQAVYGRWRRPIEGACGALLVLFGLGLAVG
jgi:threonine efflux protein